jgi:hypothetical protein
MGLKYERGTVGEAAMSAFYKKWANKMPRQSQNWRMLMTQAAKFKAAVSARARGSGARARDTSYADAQNRTYDKSIAPSQILMQAIAGRALLEGIIDRNDYDDADSGWSKLTGDTDPAKFTALLNSLEKDAAFKDGVEKTIQKYHDPKFKLGDLSNEGITRLLRDGFNGTEEYRRRAAKNGKKGDADAAEKIGDTMSNSSATVRLLVGLNGEQGFYEAELDRRNRLDSVLNDPNASPQQKEEAIGKYTKWAKTDGKSLLDKVFTPEELDATNPRTFNPAAASAYNRLGATVSALEGKATGMTFRDDPLGLSSADSGSDAEALALIGGGVKAAMDAVRSGKGIIVRTDDKGNPVASGGMLNVVDRDSVDMDTLVPYRSTDGTTHWAVSTPVKVGGYADQDPFTGALSNPIKPYENVDDVVGRMVTVLGPDGMPVTLYGVKRPDADGIYQTLWSAVNPFAGEGSGLAGTKKNSDGSVTLEYLFPQPADTVTPDPKTGVKRPVGFNPHEKVQTGGIVGPDDTGAGDSPTAFYSPMRALINSDPVTAKKIADLGDDAIAQAERDWYSNKKNWTAKMLKDSSAGVPDANIIESGVRDTLKDVQYKRNYGYTPEEQKKNHARIDEYNRQTQAAIKGVSLEQMDTQDRRKSLIDGLDNWLKQPAGYGIFGPMPANTLKKGWTSGDLLLQPGMSDAQASDLVFQITGGKQGKRLEPEKKTEMRDVPPPVVRHPGGLGGGLPFYNPNAPTQVPVEVKGPTPTNPFADKYKAGVGPQYGPPAPKPKAPMQGPPTPPVGTPGSKFQGPPTPKPIAPKPAPAPAPAKPQQYGPPAPKPITPQQYGPPAPSRAPGAPGSPVYGPPTPSYLKPQYGPPAPAKPAPAKPTGILGWLGSLFGRG